MSHSGVDTGLIEIFGRHGVSCTFAVVPAITSLYPAPEGEGSELPLTRQKILELRSAVECGAVDLALHGWNHLANAFTRHPNPSEFRGLSIEAQISILARGRDYLKQAVGREPRVFVPPWNAYDTNTLRALESTGFLGISANRYAPAGAATMLRFAPMTIEMGALRAAVVAARTRGDEEAVIGVMMHPYDFLESGDKRSSLSLEDFERELTWLLEQGDVQVLSITQLLETFPEMDQQRFRANQPSVCESLYPDHIPRLYSDPVYHGFELARIKKIGRDARLLPRLSALMIVGIILGWLAQFVLSVALGYVSNGLLLATALCGFALITRAFLAREIYGRAAALIIVMFGVCLGLML